VGSNGNKSCTVRELGGELWASLAAAPIAGLDWESKNQIVELAMGILARHIGAAIVNDEDLPVTPHPAAVKA
jgi:hypothetical protein